MARSFEVPDDEDAEIWFRGYNLLTAKPTIYAANVAEDDLADDGASNPHVAKVMAVVERAEAGGVCLNWGCIPTKALLKSAQVYIRSVGFYDFEFHALKI